MEKFYTYSSFFSLKKCVGVYIYIYIVIQWLIRPLLTHCFSLIREYYSSTSRAEFPSASAIMDGFGGADLTISRLRNKQWSWMSFEFLFLSCESVLRGSLLNFFSLICLEYYHFRETRCSDNVISIFWLLFLQYFWVGVSRTGFIGNAIRYCHLDYRALPWKCNLFSHPKFQIENLRREG